MSPPDFLGRLRPQTVEKFFHSTIATATHILPAMIGKQIRTNPSGATRGRANARMAVVLRGFSQGIKLFGELPRLLLRLGPVLRSFYASLKRWCRQPRSHRRGGCCVRVPPTEYKRPDPMLYSQSFLMKQGLAVTWDNPDIQLYDAGVAVNSSSLVPDHDYEVEVRVWNNSYDAPAAGLPVILIYQKFGVGTVATVESKTFVDLGVKGSPHCPVFAKFVWRTPPAAGHYCIQARLDWPDDANPDNNLGQENTNVSALHSPSEFTFAVRNDASVRRRFELATDTYRLPTLPQCPPATDDANARRGTRLAESRARWAVMLKTQAVSMFPPGPEWKVDLAPQAFELAGRQEIMVTAKFEWLGATPFKGRQPFNVNVFATDDHANREMAGGVTLYVEGA